MKAFEENQVLLYRLEDFLSEQHGRHMSTKGQAYDGVWWTTVGYERMPLGVKSLQNNLPWCSEWSSNITDWEKAIQSACFMIQFRCLGSLGYGVKM
jgi:hypothetical protein